MAAIKTKLKVTQIETLCFINTLPDYISIPKKENQEYI